MVSGISGEADFMIFFQFAGQQKLFTNNRLEDKNQQHYNELKLYSQVNFILPNPLTFSMIKNYRECHIFSSFIFPQPTV